MNNKIQLSIVLPAHNEAENLPKLIEDIHQHMYELGWDYEVIIVNDGSTDESIEVIKKLQEHVRIQAVHHPINRGYGASLRSGFSAAKNDYVFFMDSDHQFSIKEIHKLVQFLGGVDLVIGYRKNRQDSFIRKLNAGIFNLAVRILFGLWVRDIDCAFKIMKREILNKANLESNGALINTELLVKAKRMGYKIKQVPITHFPRTAGQQSGANIKVILRAIKEILLFRFTGRTVSGSKPENSKP